jgi:hypothetical protein
VSGGVTRAVALAALALLAVQAGPHAQESVIFSFRTGFWMHLHHFLYVLGRAEAGLPDSKRRAVAGAAADQTAGLKDATPEETAAWRTAVAAYARGLSRLDAVADPALWRATSALARLGDEQALPEDDLPAGMRAALKQAAPVYQRLWWPGHGRRSRTFVDELQTWLRLEGAVIVAFVTWVYEQQWPADGFLVEVSSYANWAGAYTTGDRLLVVSSFDPGLSGSQGLEMLFHEAMHRWDDAMQERLKAAASRRGQGSVADGLLHALVFYTAGEAVRRTVPPHIPYSEANGMWKSGPMAAFKPVLDAHWRPHLRGDTDLDEAIDRLVAARR